MKTRLYFVFSLFVLLVPASFAQDKPDALKTYRLGRDLEAQGRWADANARYDAAVSICQDEISQNSTNMDSYTVLTWALLRQKKYSDVIDWAERGLKITPNDYRIIETMGEAYFYLDNYKASLKSMQKYCDAAPDGERVSVAYFFIGEIFRLEEKYRHADIAYTTAVQLEPSLSLWWYRLGTVREAAGEYAPAAQAFQKAVDLDPGNKDAADGLARSKRRAG